VGGLVPQGLLAVRQGDTVVRAGIHMSEIRSLPYELICRYRVVRSVAILTRADAVEILPLAVRAGVTTTVPEYPPDLPRPCRGMARRWAMGRCGRCGSATGMRAGRTHDRGADG
jgi:hypothetical protein